MYKRFLQQEIQSLVIFFFFFLLAALMDGLKVPLFEWLSHSLDNLFLIFIFCPINCFLADNIREADVVLIVPLWDKVFIFSVVNFGSDTSSLSELTNDSWEDENELHSNITGQLPRCEFWLEESCFLFCATSPDMLENLLRSLSENVFLFEKCEEVLNSSDLQCLIFFCFLQYKLLKVFSILSKSI